MRRAAACVTVATLLGLAGCQREDPSSERPAPKAAATVASDNAPSDDADRYTGSQLEPTARDRWPDTFAGLWDGRGGKVFVAFTSDAAANTAELQREFPSEEMVAVTHQRSLAELVRTQNKMIADREAPPAGGGPPLPPHYDLDIDVVQNVAYAVVPNPSSRDVLAFTSRYEGVEVRPGPLMVPGE